MAVAALVAVGAAVTASPVAVAAVPDPAAVTAAASAAARALVPPAVAQRAAPEPAPPLPPELANAEQLGRRQWRPAAAMFEKWLAQAPPEHPLRFWVMTHLAVRHAVQGETEAARRWREALQAWRLRHPPMARHADAAIALVRAAEAYADSNFPEERRLAEEALRLMPEAFDARLAIRVYQYAADIAYGEGRFHEAVERHQRAVRTADLQVPGWHQVEARLLLVSALGMAGQLQATLPLLDEAERLGADDPVSQAQAAQMRSEALAELGRPADALAASTRAVELARRYEITSELALTLGSHANHLLTAGEPRKALAAAREAAELAERERQRPAQSGALSVMGLALIMLRQPDEGVAMVEKAIAINRAIAAPSVAARQQHELGEALERAGYAARALAAYRKHREMSQNSMLLEQQHAIVQLQERFARERREAELALLEKDTAVKAAEFERKALVERLWLGLAAGLTLLLAGFGWMLRRLQRTNRALRQGNSSLRRAGERDPLTGEGNRRHGTRLLELGHDEFGIFRGTLMMIDLDHFKAVNDRWGHAAGDAVLRAVAERLRRELREGDSLVRWGGEEFLVMAAPVEAETLRAWVRRMLARLAHEPLTVAGVAEPLTITISIGAACFPLAAPDAEAETLRADAAIALVDAALYRAKRRGRDQGCVVEAVPAVPTRAAWDELLRDFNREILAGRLRVHDVRDTAGGHAG